jgi:hypothetical protein
MFISSVRAQSDSGRSRLGPPQLDYGVTDPISRSKSLGPLLVATAFSGTSEYLKILYLLPKPRSSEPLQ